MAGGRSFTPASRYCASRDRESSQARVPLDIRHFMLIFFSCAAFSPTSPGEGDSILNLHIHTHSGRVMAGKTRRSIRP